MSSASERVFFAYVRVFFSLTTNFSMTLQMTTLVERKNRQQNFDTPLQNLHNEHHISFCFEKSIALLISEVEEYLSDGSGWLLDSIEELSVNIVSYHPLGGSGHIPTPEFIDRPLSKMMMINVFWCVLAHLNPTNSHPERLSLILRHIGDDRSPISCHFGPDSEI